MYVYTAFIKTETGYAFINIGYVLPLYGPVELEYVPIWW